MKILVDTHLLIWSTSDSGKLPDVARHASITEWSFQ